MSLDTELNKLAKNQYEAVRKMQALYGYLVSLFIFKVVIMVLQLYFLNSYGYIYGVAC